MAKQVTIVDNPAFNGVSAGKVTGLAPDTEKIFGTGTHDEFFINTGQGLKRFSLSSLAYQEKPDGRFGTSIGAAQEGARILQQKLEEQGIKGQTFIPQSVGGIQGITQFRPDAVRAGFADQFTGKWSGFSGGQATLDDVIAAFQSGQAPAQDFTGSENVTNTLERTQTREEALAQDPNLRQDAVGAVTDATVSAAGLGQTPSQDQAFQSQLDMIKGLKDQGLSAGEVGQILEDEGFSPQEIEKLLSASGAINGLPSGQQFANGQPEPTPADAQLAQVVTQQAASNPSGQPNAAYINGVFKAYHNRDATQEELNRYTSGQFGIDQAYREIKGGAPQPVSAEQLALEQQGYERVLNPKSMEELAATAGFDPNKIKRVGNKLFAPSELTAKVSDVVGQSGLADTSIKGLDTLGGSDLKSPDIAAAANNYADQYASQLGADFEATRKAFWDSLLLNTDFRESTLARLEGEAGLDNLSTQLTELDKLIATKQQAWNTLMEDVENSPISITAIQGRNAHIKRMASIEMEGLLGQRAALVGDYDRAVESINRAYNAAVGDYEENIEHLKDWYTENKEFFTKGEERAYQAKIKDEERNFELYKNELTSTMSLMASYPSAGISANDTYEEAINKVSLVPGSPEYQLKFDPITGKSYVFDASNGKIISERGGVGSSLNDFSSNSPASSSIEDVISFIGDQDAQIGTVELNGRTFESSNYMTRALMQADAQMKADGLQGLIINEGYRSPEKQGEYYQAFVSGTGGRAAAPGQSWHQSGLAVDVSNWEEAEKYLRPLGFVNDLADDRNHFSFGETNPEIIGGTSGQQEEAQRQLLAQAGSNLLSQYTNKSQAAYIEQQIAGYLSQGDFDSAKAFITSKAIENLPAAVYDRYTQFDTGVTSGINAINILQEADFNIAGGPWKSLAEKAKPWLDIQQDPQYAQFKQAIEQGQSQIRKGFFGAAVTGTEEKNANNFLINDNDSMPVIGQKLIGNIAFLEFANDAEVARSLGLPKPSLQDYIDRYNQEFSVSGVDNEGNEWVITLPSYMQYLQDISK